MLKCRLWEFSHKTINNLFQILKFILTTIVAMLSLTLDVNIKPTPELEQKTNH